MREEKEKKGDFQRGGRWRTTRYRVEKYLPRPRIELRAPACACGCACIQNRPGDDKRAGGVASFNPGIPSFDDGPARSQKPSLVTSTLVPKLTPLHLPAVSFRHAPSLPPRHPENCLPATGRRMGKSRRPPTQVAYCSD